MLFSLSTENLGFYPPFALMPARVGVTRAPAGSPCKWLPGDVRAVTWGAALAAQWGFPPKSPPCLHASKYGFLGLAPSKLGRFRRETVRWRAGVTARAPAGSGRCDSMPHARHAQNQPACTFCLISKIYTLRCQWLGPAKTACIMAVTA